ncbi:aminotransferase [Motiliproteus sp. MSK22-1]|nr:aminotransferase [Motiliproteus sp. MSK22-1]
MSHRSLEDLSYHIHSQTNLREHQNKGPLVIERGQGVYVYDEKGQSYLESMSGLWCTSLGFSDARLIKAATKQLETLPYYHTFNHRTNNVVSKLAAEVSGLVPLNKAKVFFASSGSEANDSMIKMAWNYHIAQGNHKRKKVLIRDRGFHGSTVMGASLSGLPHMHTAFGLPLNCTVRLECPDYYRNAEPEESESAYLDRLLDDLEATIEREGADTIAAFIAEPVMGAGGVLVPPVGYFEKVQKILRQYKILMLSDEIVCGFGRTGNWFGCQTFNFQPDMMSCAKGLTSGYIPMSCVAVSGDIYSVLEEYSEVTGVFGHGFTYSGHPTAAAVALEALRIYQEMNLPKVALELGAVLHDLLEELKVHPMVGEIRGKGVGLIAGIELVADKNTREPYPTSRIAGKKVEQAARDQGLIIRNMGDVIALCPPFITSHQELKLIVQKLSTAIDVVYQDLESALDQ